MGKVTIGSSEQVNSIIRVEELQELSPIETIIENPYDDTELRLKLQTLEESISNIKVCACAPDLKKIETTVIEKVITNPDNSYVDVKYEELNNLIEGVENVLLGKIEKVNPDLVKKDELDQKLEIMREYIEDIKAIKSQDKTIEIIKEDQKLKKLNYALIALNIVLLIINLL